MECNELINEGIDALLHDWQLKFNMIGWSGGFLQPGEGDEVVGFVARDPAVRGTRCRGAGAGKAAHEQSWRAVEANPS